MRPAVNPLERTDTAPFLAPAGPAYRTSPLWWAKEGHPILCIRPWLPHTLFFNLLITVLHTSRRDNTPAPKWRDLHDPRFVTILHTLRAQRAVLSSNSVSTQTPRPSSALNFPTPESTWSSVSETRAAADACAGDLDTTLAAPVHGAAVGALKEALDVVVDNSAVMRRNLMRVSLAVNAQGIH
jgi:hypothetical protein